MYTLSLAAVVILFTLGHIFVDPGNPLLVTRVYIGPDYFAYGFCLVAITRVRLFVIVMHRPSSLNLAWRVNDPLPVFHDRSLLVHRQSELDGRLRSRRICNPPPLDCKSSGSSIHLNHMDDVLVVKLYPLIGALFRHC